MVSTPKKPTTEKLQAPVVLLGSTPGTDPTLEDETDVWRCIRIVRSIGLSNSDQAILVSEVGQLGRIADVELTSGTDVRVEIRIPDSKGNIADNCIFAGEVKVIDYGITEDESEQLIVEIPRYLYGGAIQGQEVWDSKTSDVVVAHEDLVFNPVINGIIDNNMSSKVDPNRDYNLFFDPESGRTTTAQEIFSQTIGPLRWTISKAIKYLTGSLNSTENFIENPGDLTKEVESEAIEFLNVYLKRGDYLPEILDRILRPFGLFPYIAFTTDGGASKRSLKVASKLSGNAKEVLLQAEGDTYEKGKSNVIDSSLQYGIDTITTVTGHGGMIQKQVTVELYRGWAEGSDDKEATDLDKNDSTSDYGGNENVWRLWVANEAGDYCDLRTTVEPIPDTPLDLSNVFDNYYPRRRVFEDCLTFEDVSTGDDQARYRQPVVEYYDPSEDEWKLVPVEWGGRITSEQMGFEFTGGTPPTDLLDLENPDDDEHVKIRVTGVISGDQRVSYTKDADDSSPNSNDIELFLDLSDRFQDRQVQDTGEFENLVNGTHDEHDDTQDLEEFVDAVHTKENAATVSGTFVLMGYRPSFELGDRITKINGRNISLNRLSNSASSKRYPVVTQIEYNFEGNVNTVLRVESI